MHSSVFHVVRCLLWSYCERFNCMCPLRQQVAAPLTWWASPTSMLSTLSWTTWNWSVKSTALSLGLARIRSSLKVRTVCNTFRFCSSWTQNWVFKYYLTFSSSVEEFVHAANKFGQITPMEIDILFQLSGLHSQTGYYALKKKWFIHTNYKQHYQLIMCLCILWCVDD